MRVMIKKNEHGEVVQSLNIVEHIILRNFWEYYITDEHFTKDIVTALVMGDFIELGDVSLSEIKPYTITRTKRLNEVAACERWEWES